MNPFAEFLKDYGLDDRFSATEETVSFVNAKAKKFVLELKDLHEALRTIWSAGEALSDALGGDWTYEEGKYRNALRKVLENRKSNSVVSMLGSQTPNTVRSLELFAHFLLGKEPPKELYSPDVLRASELTPIFSPSPNEASFRSWLKTVKALSDKSVNSYVGAIKGILSRCATVPLLDILNSSSLEALRAKVLSHADVLGLDSRGNGMYTAAFNNYADFLGGGSTVNLGEVFDAICKFCREYDQAGEAWRKDSPRCLEVRRNLAKLNDWLRAYFSAYEGRSLTVKSSDGATNFPKVPWICILPEGQEVNDGVYVSICFDRHGRGAVSGFAESATNPKGLVTVRRTGEDLRIDVNGPSSGTRFNDGFVNPEEFYKDNFDSNKLRDHIAKSLDLCLNHLGGNQLMPMTPDDKNNFVTALQKSGFVTQPGLPEAFLQSLIAKPFVILTGNSGTGKTKIAEMLSVWLHGDRSDCHELVAVGADWTDNRNVLGFVNHLRGNTPVYQSTHVLDLLMRARTFGSKPFFLILDEMNLSHVERYFADFLSAMESSSSELHLHTEGGETEQLPTDPAGQAVVPRKLAIPANVFVIGTVNVDETTYMFSPKVLDRANVIEFRMPAGSVGTFMKAGKTGSLKMEYAGDGVAERFLSLVREARADKLPDPSDGDSMKQLAAALDSVFDIMRDARLEFGFRTINEIRRYLRVDCALTQAKSKWNWQNAFDAQLLQKILPKLSGSRRRLEDLLVRLAVFCESSKVTPLGATTPTNLQSVPIKRDEKPHFPFSYRKLCDMLDAVRRDQFVSFIQ
jgi:5-methylcytosine-specific restriction protein B